MTTRGSTAATGPRRGLRWAGAAAFVAAGVYYLVGEAVTAAAWRTPPYSHARNWVSDLGVPGCGTVGGRAICSPLHVVQNVAFVTEGVLFAGGAAVVALLFRGVLRTALAAFAPVTGVGQVVVGLVPSSSRAASGLLHVVGAGVGIVSPLVLAAVVGVVALRRGMRALAALSLALALVGAVSTVLLVATTRPATPSGVLERTAIYATIAWQMTVGAALLAGPWVRVAVDRP